MASDPLPLPVAGLGAPPPVPSPSRVPFRDHPSTKTSSPLAGAVSSAAAAVAATAAAVAAPNVPFGEVSKDDVARNGPAHRRPGRSATTRNPPTSSRVRIAPVDRRSLHPKTTARPQPDVNTAEIPNPTTLNRYDIVPDGGSTGRGGRQFAVANVGNNGRIYLRPTVRTGNQRCPQPQFNFPATPPSTASLDPLAYERAIDDQRSELQWTPSPEASTFLGIRNYCPGPPQDPEHPVKHRRAMSDSTVHEAIVTQDQESGHFKVVISKPGEEARPRTTEDIDPNNTPLLDINIPSWRIGTPRFTTKGTPMIRGSSYAPTEDIRSSSASLFQRSGGFNSSHTESRRPSSLAMSPFRQSRRISLAQTISTVRMPRAVPPYTYNIKIEPAMFDDLTFKPACDERSLVRYSPASSAVTAATPPRLVAEITSPSFLDYELISDFFLTFRAFLDPTDLLRMLIARLRWALARQDEMGMVVRVRTFVALRHWILNYFMDDFVIDYDLRVTFCELLNDFVDELAQCDRSRKVQLKILTELKKCWRRVCALYWDGDEFDDGLAADVPVTPGGIAGHRDPSLDPTFWDRPDGVALQLEGFLPLVKNAHERSSFIADISRAGHVGDSVVVDNRPSTPEGQVIDMRVDSEAAGQSMSPISMSSVDIISCSFPNKNMRSDHPQMNPLAAHPVAASSVYNQTGTVATTPRTLVGKRVRPTPHTHKRNGSLTDSMREHSTDNKVPYKDQEFLMTMPYAGSLVRGNLLPPGQAFVDVNPDDLPDLRRHTAATHPDGHNMLKERTPAGAMSGHGMKKLIGSVRRALSTRTHGQPANSVNSSLDNIAALGPRGGTTTNRPPGSAVVPQQQRARPNGARPPVRIDLLGAEAAEDFKKAVREETAAEAERQGLVVTTSEAVAPAVGYADYSAAHMDSTPGQHQTFHRHQRTISSMGITTGSQSIVIVDDTMPFDTSLLHRPTTSDHASVEAFADTLMSNGANPTPPTTPPAPSMGGGTPRRSSYLLNQHVMRPSLDEDPLPPFVPDLDGLVPSARPSQDSARPTEDDFRTSEDSMRPSQDSVRPTPPRTLRHYPPVSFRGHRKNKSTKTHQSIAFTMLKRRNSIATGASHHSPAQSFDATTYSGESVLAHEPDPTPQPLRPLRRRPGGDLKAATNVAELDTISLRRSRSLGSLTTYSESIRSSFVYSPRVASGGFQGRPLSADSPQKRAEVFSLGKLAEKPLKRDLSLFTGDSSKPVMRASFEVEAFKLAQIPDDEDDGGIESALLKLEGRFDRKPSRPSLLRGAANTNVQDEDMLNPSEIGVAIGGSELSDIGSHGSRHHENYRETFMQALGSDASDISAEERPGPLGAERHTADISSFLFGGSQASSTHGQQDEDEDQDITLRPARTWKEMSVLEATDDEAEPDDEVKPTRATAEAARPDLEDDSRHPSYDFIIKTDSIEDIKKGKTVLSDLASESADQSFLNDDSDLSSELSIEDAPAYLDCDDDEELPPLRIELPSHPLGSPTPPPRRAPPSPPMTLVQALEMSPPQRFAEPELQEHQIWVKKPLPPSPEMTPTAPCMHGANGASTPNMDQVVARELANTAPKPEGEGQHSKFSVHLPFVLAFDSEILAQQFTLIEKDALNEIDWKDLIDMNWKNATSNDSRSWVDFLRKSDAQGVEVVIARFNLMVKWVISEVVLTQNLEERVRCITKFIHVATHCRRYRNFATLAQLAIALSSNEVARLTKTWDLVHPQDIKTLQELENLVTPMRNFYNLRAEMETGSDIGCIPFVGIYTHDLLYNAQRPSEIAGSPTTPPLINFERCRIAATVVKTLLRLLEASTRYEFQPIEGITERCLWMSALSDDEIRRHSDSLQ